MLRTASRGCSTPGGRSSLLLAKAHLHGAGVRFEALGASQRGDGGRKLREAARGQFLNRDDLHEVGRRESAANARCAGSGKHMIGARRVVACRFRAGGSEKDAACMLDLLSAGSHRKAARCSGASRFDASTAASSDGQRITALWFADRLAGHRGGGQRFELAGHFGRNLFGQFRRSGQQDGGRFDVVLRLRQHVGGDVARIGVVGDDDDLGGAGDEIDADFTRQKFLRSRDVDVAGADDAIDFRESSRCRTPVRRWLARRRCGTRCETSR